MRMFLFVILMLLLAIPAYGQDIAQPEMQRHSWHVFTKRGAENPLQTDVIFIDLLTGESSVVSANGERYTLTANGVIYLDIEDAQVKLAKADGIIRDHPFINMTVDAHRIDWVVSDDKQRIAWTISHKLEDEQLITSTWLADLAGSEIRELLVYGPRAGILLLPIAISEDNGEIFMEVYADGSDDLSPYTLRTGLFSLLISDNEVITRSLPGDQTCFCAVGFGAGLMLRLSPKSELNGLDVEVYPLDGGPPVVIPALSRGNYSEAGNVLISPDGKRAIYALSQVRGFATAQEKIRTVLALVDLVQARQRIISEPIPALIRPISYTEDSSAVLFTTENGDGSWKIDLEDGRTTQVADATYLGIISDHWEN